MPAGKLTPLNSKSKTPYEFLAVEIPQGFLAEFPSTVEEELTVPGIDGARWRTVGLKHRNFTLRTVSEYVSFTAAVKAAGLMARASGLCDLEITTVEKTYLYREVHILGVTPVPRRGLTTGAGASANNLAHVLAEWAITLTNLDPNVTA